MKLSPLELRKHQFVKRFRLSGYDPDEVNGFIRQMADQWADLLDENRRFEDRTRELEDKLRHYEQVELALQEALETARNTARQLEDNAQRKADLTVEEAELRAQRMLQDAEQERYSIKQDLVKLSSRQTEIAARMRAFLMAEMEVLAQFQGDDPSGFLRLISASDVAPPAMLEEATIPSDSAPVEEPVPEVDTSSDSWQNEEIVTASIDSVEEPEEVPTADELGVTADAPETVGLEPVEPVGLDPVEPVGLDPVEPVGLEPVETFSPPPIPAPITLDTEASSEPASADKPEELEHVELHPVISATETPPPVPAESESPPDIPFPDPVWPPVKEADVLPPPLEPVVLETVEELIAQTQPPPPVPHLGHDETPSPPTYGEMLSGSQSSGDPEEQRSPFSSSFFVSPLSDADEPSEVPDPEPVPGSDSAQDWSLRSVVAGDGESEPTSTSASEAERDRIRRILEDLD